MGFRIVLLVLRRRQFPLETLQQVAKDARSEKWLGLGYGFLGGKHVGHQLLGFLRTSGRDSERIVVREGVRRRRGGRHDRRGDGDRRRSRLGRARGQRRGFAPGLGRGRKAVSQLGIELGGQPAEGGRSRGRSRHWRRDCPGWRWEG